MAPSQLSTTLLYYFPFELNVIFYLKYTPVKFCDSILQSCDPFVWQNLFK